MGTLCIVINAILVAIGWALIWRCQVHEHRNIMLWVAFFALTFSITYVVRTIFIGSTAFGGPSPIKVYCVISLVSHIILATVDDVLGLTQIILVFKDKPHIRRKIGPRASVVWFSTVITGVTVYVLLHVLHPGGEVTPLLKATLGL